jgi:hypothetical protein
LKDSIPFAGLDAAVAALGENLPEHANEMLPIDDLSNHLFEPPPPEHLHVIVELPRRKS